jgi:16S rRNA (cytosine1407-C5)-methyltransferase
MIPPKLSQRLKELGQEAEKIYSAMSRKAFLGEGSEKVPFFPRASYDGSGYVFDAASAVPAMALDPKKNEKILDMCAAPGTKTILIAEITDNEAYIVANDISRTRILRLRENIEKYHISAIITNKSGRIINENFDKVLLDAPCSGEGIVNKQKKIFAAWSERRIKFLAKKQKKLISNAFRILNDQGILVYSTCTFAPEENEEVVQFLLDKNSNARIEKIEIENLIYSKGILNWRGKEFTKEMKKCIRIYPYQNETQGFFVAKIRKIKNRN